MPILIAGAGEAGVTIAREIRSNPALGLDLVGFLDDDPSKQNMWIHGAPVLGRLESLPEIVREGETGFITEATPQAMAERRDWRAGHPGQVFSRRRYLVA